MTTEPLIGNPAGQVRPRPGTSTETFSEVRALLYRCLSQLPKNIPLAKEIKAWMERHPAP